MRLIRRHSISPGRLWTRRAYAAPAPTKVKRAVLLRNGIRGSTWIETGTYRGDTTHFLAKRFPAVVTIEPSRELFDACERRFRNTSNVTVICGTSEEHLLPTLRSTVGPVSLWLDGHFSGGPTYMGAGPCPVLDELRAVSEIDPKSRQIALLVDDIRLFGSSGLPGRPGYPMRDDLVEWAASHGLWWTIEHDVFVARSNPPEQG